MLLLSVYIPDGCGSSSARTPSAAIAVEPVTCALTYLMLHRRTLYLYYNQITSLSGLTFPASLE
jgi:hypothetical protein